TYDGKNQNFTPSAFVEITPIAGLTLRTQGGMDYYNFRVSERRLPSYKPNVNNGTASESWRQALSRTITNTAEYKFALDEVHDISLLAGQEYTDFSENYFI